MIPIHDLVELPDRTGLDRHVGVSVMDELERVPVARDFLFAARLRAGTWLHQSLDLDYTIILD